MARQVDTLCVEVTARCPLQCVHCSANASPWRHEMLSTSLFQQRMGELPRLKELYLSGGEPFEHSALTQLVSIGSAAANTVVVYTSGVRIGASGIEPIAVADLRSVRDAGVARLDVSVYAPKAESHDWVTQTSGSLECTLETLRRLRAADVPFGIHYVPITDNVDFIGLREWAIEWGATRLHILSLSPQGRGRALQSPNFRRGVLEELRRIYTEKSPIEVVLSSAMRRLLAINTPVSRDALMPAMLDIRGFLYPGEGQRLPVYRSKSSIGSRGIHDLLAELSPT